MNLPKSRSRSIVVQTLGKETLIYDLDANRAFYLNETLSVVFNHCDGKTSIADLKRRYKYADDLIYFALDELQKNILIDGDKITHFAGMNRRDVIKRIGLSTMFALPVISALAAPSAAQAASVCAARTQTCVPDGINTQGTCCNGLRCFGGNRCFECIASRGSYALDNSVDDCNRNPLKNGCCNTTDSATRLPATGSCLCP